MKPIVALLPLLLWPALSTAQDVEAALPPEAPAIVFSGPQFFAALFVGFALAVAFQLVLTNLSVAVGISAFDAREAGAGQSSPGREGDRSVMQTLRTVSTGYGLWTLVTASLALFVASWLAVQISMGAGAAIGAILGLTVWGLFYIAMTALQVGAATSLVGSLITTATSGLRSMGEAAGSLLGRSPERQTAETAAQVVAAVREEIFGSADAKDIREQIRSFLRELKPRQADPKEIRKELETLFEDHEVRAMLVRDGELDDKKLLASFQSKYGSPERRRAAMDWTKQAAATAAEEARSDKPMADKIVEGGLRLAGKSKQEAEGLVRDWEEFLRRTGKQELDPTRIKREIETLVRDPKQGAALLKSRAREAFNKSTVATVLAQRTDMSQEEAERTADRAEQIIREFRQKGRGAQQQLDELKERAAARLREYLNGLNRPELRYEGLQDDLQRLFQEPAAGAEALLRRAQSLDRKTVKALLASSTHLSSEDAEHLVNQIESARDTAMRKAEEMKREIERRLAQLKEEALRQAEEARQTAANAAWWAFATAVGSGAAAILGGIAGAA